MTGTQREGGEEGMNLFGLCGAKEMTREKGGRERRREEVYKQEINSDTFVIGRMKMGRWKKIKQS